MELGGVPINQMGIVVKLGLWNRPCDPLYYQMSFVLWLTVVTGMILSTVVFGYAGAMILSAVVLWYGDWSAMILST